MKVNGSVGWGRRKLSVLVIAFVFGVILFLVLKNNVSIEELVAREESLREAIAARPWRSFVIGLAIYFVVALVPGTSGKSMVYGWLYGLWQGGVIVVLGLTAAAMVNFFLSRHVFRGWIEHRYGRFLSALNRHLDEEGAFYLIVLRMAHFPYSILNLASGASRVRPRTFLWTTALGLLPGSAVFAYVGHRLPSLNELTVHGPGSLLDAPLIAALAVSAVFPFVFRAVARRLGLLKTGGNGSGATAEPQPHVPRS